jgi:hypothetical protein
VSALRPQAILCALVAVAVAACAGGGTSTNVPAHVPTATVTFAIAVPAHAGSAHLRKPKYVSPNVASATIAFVPIPPNSQAVSTTVDLAGGSADCSGTPRVCTATLRVPIGLDNFTITTYAGSDGGGAQLSVGSLVETIVAGSNAVGANTIDLTLNGVVARFAVTTSPASIAYGPPVPVQIGIEARDATGAVIIGPGSFNVPITLSTPVPYVPGQFLNAQGQDVFAPGAQPLQILAPSSPLTVTAVTETNGQVLPGLAPVTAIGATAPGVAGSPAEFHVGGIPTRPPGGPVVQPAKIVFPTVTSPTQTFSVSEQNYSGTFTVQVADPSIVSVSGVPNAPNDFYAVPLAAGSTTLRVSDQFGTTTIVPVSVKGPFTLSPPRIQFAQNGGPQQVTVTQLGTSSFSASSQDATVATVSPASGAGPFTVTPVGFGFTQIVFSNDIGQTATLAVTVGGAVAVSPSLLVFSGPTAPPQGFTASVQGATSYTATSLDPQIATVSGGGGGKFSVAPVAAGTTAITVASNNGKQGIVLVYVNGVVVIVNAKERRQR